MPALDCRLGIDVGGTNTDAVILDTADRVLAKAKVPVHPGHHRRHHRGDRRGHAGAGRATRARITHVMLGTTHATNARAGAPAAAPGGGHPHRRPGHAQRPPDVRLAWRPAPRWSRPARRSWTAASSSTAATCPRSTPTRSPGSSARPPAGRGGRDHQRVRPRLAAARAAGRGRRQARAGRRSQVSLSHEIGSLGLLERENATILNAALIEVARDVAERACRPRWPRTACGPTTYFAQNDGTLMALDHALRYPVLTIGSGPANSIRGAAFLTGSADALVADVGGTSTDVGVLVNGFPRGVLAGRRDRRHQDQLPDARPGHDRARRRHRSIDSVDGRARIGPQQRRLPAAGRGAGVRRNDAHAHRQRGRGGPGRARRRAPARGPPATCSRTRPRRRRRARRRDRPDQDVQGRRGRSSPSAAAASLSPTASPASARSSAPTTSTRPTRSAPPSPRSAARSTGSSTWAPAAGRPILEEARTRRGSTRSPPAPTPTRSRSSSSRRSRWRTSPRPRSGSAPRRPAPSAACPSSICKPTWAASPGRPGSPGPRRISGHPDRPGGQS